MMSIWSMLPDNAFAGLPIQIIEQTRISRVFVNLGHTSFSEALLCPISSD